VAYALRAWLLVFLAPPAPATQAAGGGAAEPTAGTAGAEPHEAPVSMRLPLYLLSIPTALGGLAVAYPQAILGEPVEELSHPAIGVTMTALVVATAALVTWAWRRNEGGDPWVWQPVEPVVDRAYATAVVRPVERLARVVRGADRDVIETYAEGVGASARGAGWLLRRAQAGNVQAYLAVVLVGACLLAVVGGLAAGVAVGLTGEWPWG
jgi:NADH-quinone oxidoreductase subunit L